MERELYMELRGDVFVFSVFLFWFVRAVNLFKTSFVIAFLQRSSGTQYILILCDFSEQYYDFCQNLLCYRGLMASCFAPLRADRMSFQLHFCSFLLQPTYF